MLNYKKNIILMVFIIFIFFFSFSQVSAEENSLHNNISINNNSSIQKTINNSLENGIIILEPGLYSESGIIIDKNITIMGNSSRENIIIDGNYSNNIFIIKSNRAYVNFINITFINGRVDGHGGAIHSEAGNVFVDNCAFINNTASVNGGAIDNYGTETAGYLFVNNSLFIGNYAGHDGGAITTYRGNTDIYNSIFVNNHAKRDGGAIRGEIYTNTNIYNCSFDNNYADEWGGALYIWTSNSTIQNSTFTNNNAGTYGGAIFTSAKTIVKDSIFFNNSAEFGGLIYIVQKLEAIPLNIIFNNNLIINNSAAHGDDVYMGNAIYVEYSASNIINFENNDWGTDNPEWEKRFFTNNFTNFPKNWIKTVKDILNPSNNTTPYQEKINQTNNPIFKPLSDIFNFITQNYLNENINIVSNNTNSKSVGFDSLKAQKQNSYELNINKEAKKIYNNDFIKYLIIFVLIVVLIVIGYKRF
ncbi:hypothetical protein MBBAR_5c00300 [Methanobrevibacter arboriphilus JCM 13429 = DSM 1125]|uniref:Adhesin-like protein n=1 Tax=Methanobrevibacter arboriphilus JCM 13429 = DSM 1125 TaxID=1300164 RepID=A0A1V6N3L0_METAZ|nr:hypothetical protein [Methanobrevibacter arboriphilus]OQD59187.1 hypothetical protein MBBAR_5c00300 [Methanobrevibacter arboriphilus JCM 13429 = DSM 1125]